MSTYDKHSSELLLVSPALKQARQAVAMSAESTKPTNFDLTFFTVS